MNKATITKTLKKVENLKNDKQSYSLGFCRLHSLTVKIKRNFDLAAYLELDSLDIFNYQRQFLGELTDQEFINWMKVK